MKVLIIISINLILSVSCLAQLPEALENLAGTNDWKVIDIQKNYVGCLENEAKTVFVQNFKVEDSEWAAYCSCLTEKYVTNHKRKNDRIQNLSPEIGGQYGTDCYVNLGLLVRTQERSGNYSKPGHDGVEHKKFFELTHLVGTNGFDEMYIHNAYETCINNTALFHEFDKAGHSRNEYVSYCKCLVETIVQKEIGGPEVSSEFIERLEEYSVNCYAQVE